MGRSLISIFISIMFLPIVFGCNPSYDWNVAGLESCFNQDLDFHRLVMRDGKLVISHSVSMNSETILIKLYGESVLEISDTVFNGTVRIILYGNSSVRITDSDFAGLDVDVGTYQLRNNPVSSIISVHADLFRIAYGGSSENILAGSNPDLVTLRFDSKAHISGSKIGVLELWADKDTCAGHHDSEPAYLISDSLIDDLRVRCQNNYSVDGDNIDKIYGEIQFQNVSVPYLGLYSIFSPVSFREQSRGSGADMLTGSFAGNGDKSFLIPLSFLFIMSVLVATAVGVQILYYSRADKQKVHKEMTDYLKSLNIYSYPDTRDAFVQDKDSKDAVQSNAAVSNLTSEQLSIKKLLERKNQRTRAKFSYRPGNIQFVMKSILNEAIFYGLDEKKIRTNLPEEFMDLDIKYGFSNIRRLNNYVSEHLDKGFSMGSIMSVLMQYGWDRKLLDLLESVFREGSAGKP